MTHALSPARPLWLLLWGSLLCMGSTCSSPMNVRQAGIGPGVREALVEGRAVPVIVALEPPPSTLSTAEQKAHIRAAQEVVLAALPSDAFVLRIRYEAVPALAGNLQSIRGLEILRDHPRVRSVDVDPAGGGTGG